MTVAKLGASRSHDRGERQSEPVTSSVSPAVTLALRDSRSSPVITAIPGSLREDDSGGNDLQLVAQGSGSDDPLADPLSATTRAPSCRRVNVSVACPRRTSSGPLAK